MQSREGNNARESDVLVEAIDNPFSQIEKCKPLVNLRKEQRLETQFAAQVATELGSSELVVVTDISASGLRVATFWQVVRELIPDPSDPNPIILRIKFSLPCGAGDLQRVKLLGEPVYTRLDNEDNHYVGISIIQFEEGKSVLLDFLADHGIRE
jgi:hypothetical protein